MILSFITHTKYLTQIRGFCDLDAYWIIYYVEKFSYYCQTFFLRYIVVNIF